MAPGKVLSLIRARNYTKCLSSLAMYHERINLNIKPKYEEDSRTREGAWIPDAAGQLWNCLPPGFLTSVAKDTEKVFLLSHWPTSRSFVCERHSAELHGDACCLISSSRLRTWIPLVHHFFPPKFFTLIPVY